MEQDKYKMKLLNIEMLPEVATAGTIKQMIEEDKYKWREQGMTKTEVKDRVQKKLFAAHICTGEMLYYHAYSLLARIREN